MRESEKSFRARSSSAGADSSQRVSASRVCSSFPHLPVRAPIFLSILFLGESFLSRHHSEGTVYYRTTPWAPGRGPGPRPDSPGSPIPWLWTGGGRQEPTQCPRQDSRHVHMSKSDSFFWDSVATGMLAVAVHSYLSAIEEACRSHAK